MKKENIYRIIIVVCFVLSIVLMSLPLWHLDFGSFEEVTGSVKFEFTGNNFIFGGGDLAELAESTDNVLSDVMDLLSSAAGFIPYVGTIESMLIDTENVILSDLLNGVADYGRMFNIFTYIFPIAGLICSLILKPNKKIFYIVTAAFAAAGFIFMLNRYIYFFEQLIGVFPPTFWGKLYIAAYIVNIIVSIAGIAGIDNSAAVPDNIQNAAQPVPLRQKTIIRLQTAAPAVGQPALKFFCPNCGTENPVGDKFCKNCGTKLED